MWGGELSGFTHVMVVGNVPHRPRYERKWARRKAEGDPRADNRLVQWRVFVPTGLGTLKSKVEGKVVESPAMHGVSIPIRGELNLDDYLAVITAVGNAFTEFSARLEKTPEHLRRKTISYRTIRIEPDLRLYIGSFGLTEDVRSVLAEVARQAYSASGYPSNFTVEKIVAAGTLQGDYQVLQEFLDTLKSRCKVKDHTINQKALLGDEEEDGEEYPDHAEAYGEEDDDTEQEMEELSLVPEGPVRAATSEAEKTVSREDSGFSEDASYDVPAERVNARESHQMAPNEPTVSPAREEDETPALPPPPFRRQLLETRDDEEKEETSNRPIDPSLPAPEIAALHLVAAPIAYLTGWPVVLMLPLLARHPSLVLVVLEMLLAAALWNGMQSGLLQDPYLVVFLYAFAFASGTVGVLVTYRVANYELSLFNGFLVLARWAGRMVQLLVRLVRPPMLVPGAAGQGTAGGGAITAVHVVHPRATDGKREHQQAVDLLTAVALLAALHPTVHFLPPVLLGLALSVEAGHANPLTPALAIGYLVRMIAGNPIHHAIGVLLMIIGTPMVRAVRASAYREEISKAVRLLHSAAETVKMVGRPAALRERLAVLLRGEEEAAVEWRIPPNPVRPALDNPVLATLSRALEEELQIRPLLERYVKTLERRAKSQQIAKRERSTLLSEKAFWEGVQRQSPLVGFLLHPDGGVWRTRLQPVYHPAIADLPVGGASAYESFGYGRHRQALEAGTVRELFEEGGWQRIVGRVLERKDVRPLVKSGQVMHQQEEGLYYTHIRAITPEHIAAWKSLIREGRFPKPFATEKGVFIPFALSSLTGGMPELDGRWVVGLEASPEKNAHLLGGQVTRGGKTSTVLVICGGVMTAYSDPSIPIRIGIMAIDGKTDLSSALESVTSHPAIFTPPHRLDLDRPIDTLYHITAAFGAMKARIALHNFLVRTAADMIKNDPRLWDELLRLSEGRLEGLLKAATTMEAIRIVLPQAGMLLLIIDELWGLATSLKEQLGVVSVQIGKDTVRVRADAVVDTSVLQLTVMGASTGIIELLFAQTVRKDATDLPGIRDNMNVLRGAGIPPSIIQPLLTRNMIDQEGVLLHAYQMQTGRANIPQFSWMLYMRGSGYGAAVRRSGRWEILSGGSGRGGESYEVDCIYAPEMRPDLLPREAEPVSHPDWSRVVLERMARYAQARGLFPELPAVLRPLADGHPGGLRYLLESMIATKIEKERVLQIGRAAIVEIAQSLQGERIVAEEQ